MWYSRTAHAVTAAALLFVTVNIDDPYLSPARRWSNPAIATIAGVGLLLSRRCRRGSALCTVLWATIPLTQMIVDTRSTEREIRVLDTPPHRATLLGRHFIVGYRDLADVEPLARRGLIGGIYVTRHNIAGRGPAALHDEIAHLQAIRTAAGLPALIVATDQEGGIVTHLSPPLSAWPALADLVPLPPDQRRTQATAEGRGIGKELAALGVTVDFAPVVDLRPAGGHRRFDFNTLIEQRAIAADPDVTGQIALAFARGLSQAGVHGTAKHFPGLGRVESDTHHFTASLTTDEADLETSDWQPFRSVLAQPGTFLMVGHVVVQAIDRNHPASQSKAVITGLLRERWRFDGPIVTDDLVMSAVFQHGICQGVVDSLTPVSISCSSRSTAGNTSA
jgi:beta-N-acetylhexosaminidase